MDEPHAALCAEAQLLSGLRVVELGGGGMAAALVGMLLAEQGAEVVRVASPPDAEADPLLHAILGRGKTEAELDWREPAQRGTLRRLLAGADVAIQGQPPVPGSRPALDFDELRAESNPGLVSCCVRPFPTFDPRAQLPGYEAVAGAAGCLYGKPIGLPRYHGFPVGSVTAALYGACGIMAALLARARLGRGQHVETSLLHANLVSQVLQIFMRAGVPRGFVPLKMVGSPAMRCWECRDGRYIYLHITMPAHNVRILDLLEQAGLGPDVARLRAVMSPQTLRDPSQVGSIAEADKLKQIYEQIFRRRTADEWEALLGLELCCIKVRTSDEWLRDSLAAGMSDACRLEDPEFGELLGPGPLVTSPEIATPLRPRARDPELWRHILARWSSRPSPLADGAPATPAPRPEAPLCGIRVVDLSRVIAGPCAARVLAELGADVLSIQSPTSLDWALSFHLLFNAGKKSVTLDFTTDAGKKRLWALLGAYRPDAFIQNYRHLDIARAAGVDPDAVRRRFPEIAYVHLNAYGNHGIWKDRPGFEQVVQAVSGIQLAYARGGRPRLLPSPVIDIGCGLLGAFGALLALYRRRKTGAGAFVTTHLTSVSVLLQLPEIAARQRQACYERAAARGLPIERRPDEEIAAAVLTKLGVSALLAGPRRDLRSFLAEAGIAPTGGNAEEREIEAAARHFSPLSLLQWPRAIRRAGVAGTVALLPCPSMRRLVHDIRRYDPRPRPFLHLAAYPGCPRPLAFMRSPIGLSLSPLPDISPTPVRGADTAAVLALIGEPARPGAGVVPYPSSKPLLVWLASLVRWGYFAWKSGNI